MTDYLMLALYALLILATPVVGARLGPLANELRWTRRGELLTTLDEVVRAVVAGELA